jgi:phosphoribosyl 1,2-cyclic phosphodiesterase
MSLSTLKRLLKANDLTSVNNIVLIHLSSNNSNEKLFKQEIENVTGKIVTIAKPDIEIEFNKQHF